MLFLAIRIESKQKCYIWVETFPKLSFNAFLFSERVKERGEHREWTKSKETEALENKRRRKRRIKKKNVFVVFNTKSHSSVLLNWWHSPLYTVVRLHVCQSEKMNWQVPCRYAECCSSRDLFVPLHPGSRRNVDNSTIFPHTTTRLFILHFVLLLLLLLRFLFSLVSLPLGRLHAERSFHME